MASPAYIGSNNFAASSILHPSTTPFPIPSASKFQAVPYYNAASKPSAQPPSQQQDRPLPNQQQNSMLAKATAADNKLICNARLYLSRRGARNGRECYIVDITPRSKELDLLMTSPASSDSAPFRYLLPVWRICGQRRAVRRVRAGIEGRERVHYLLFLWLADQRTVEANLCGQPGCVRFGPGFFCCCERLTEAFILDDQQ